MFPFLVLATWSQGAVFRCQQCSQALRSSEIRGGGYGPPVPLPVEEWICSLAQMFSRCSSAVRVAVLQTALLWKYCYKLRKQCNLLMNILGRLVGVTVSYSFTWIAVGCVLLKQFSFKKPQWSCFNFLTIWGNGLCHQRRVSVHIRKCSIVCSFSLELQSLKSWHLYGITWYPEVPLQSSCNKK